MYILEQGYGLAKESEDHRQQAAFLVNMAGTARTAGQEDRALGYARQALGLVSSGTALQGLLFNTMADINYRRKDPEAAKHYLRSAEHTSELQSLMRISYADFCLKKKKPQSTTQQN